MVQPLGAAFIAERMLPDGVEGTAITIMAITTLAPPPDAGAVRLRGTMAAELPMAPGEAPPRGVAGPVASQDSEAALLRGVVAPAPTMELSVARAAGVDFTVDSGDNRPPIVEGSLSAILRKLMLVHRLAYSSDVAAGQLAVFRGASEAPISELIRVERATRKNNQLAAAQRVVLKMGRRPSGGCRIGCVSI